MKSKRLPLISVSVALLLTLGFIWYNSTLSIADSREESAGLLASLQPLLDAIFGVGTITNHILRKAAHFCEFTLLGGELRLLFWLLEQRGMQGQANALFAGLAAAVTDETIQLFFDRGSMVQDVLLDFSGVFAGALLLFLAARLPARCGKKRAET